MVLLKAAKWLTRRGEEQSAVVEESEHLAVRWVSKLRAAKSRTAVTLLPGEVEGPIQRRHCGLVSAPVSALAKRVGCNRYPFLVRTWHLFKRSVFNFTVMLRHP